MVCVLWIFALSSKSELVLEQFDYVTVDYYGEAISSKDHLMSRGFKWINSHILKDHI